MAGNPEISRGNLGELIGRHIDRMSQAVCDAEGDRVALDQELMMLDGLSHPILCSDKGFLEGWKALPSLEAPSGQNQDVWNAQRRWQQFRLIVKALYDNHVLSKSATPSYEADDF